MALQLLSARKLKQRVESIRTLPSAELKVLLSDPANSIYFVTIANTLHQREESLDFAFPIFLEATLSRSPSHVLMGKNCLKAFFPEAVKEIDLEKTFLSKEAKTKLTKLLDQIVPCTQPMKQVDSNPT